MSWDADEAKAFRLRDWMQQMTASPGWSELARWAQERIEDEARNVENGAADWADYQYRLGRLKALKEVLGYPGELVEKAGELERGDING